MPWMTPYCTSIQHQYHLQLQLCSTSNLPSPSTCTWGFARRNIGAIASPLAKTRRRRSSRE
ncbi:hypothetical protein P167DRAFT_1156 [Morchella conica CCBAS932]|uniref:Uncharacterized protein n=1 Tax=Morchella conica CCBAS932 TaxID=1392247 RepID=A0A3N4L3L6_9PEZI|nr:hypothetical protein P167DRAFT_1156 [Morchella conica CCBAS932]